MAQYVYTVNQAVTTEDMVVYKFVLIISGALCVITSGMIKMPVLYVEC